MQSSGEILSILRDLVNKRGFRFSVERNSHLRWFFFTSLSDWLKRLVPLSHPNRNKAETNRDLRDLRDWFAHTCFSAFCTGHMYLLWVLIGPLDCLRASYVIVSVITFAWYYDSISWRPLYLLTTCWIRFIFEEESLRWHKIPPAVWKTK